MIHESTVDGIRILEMDDGKVNFLSLPMRKALMAAIENAGAGICHAGSDQGSSKNSGSSAGRSSGQSLKGIVLAGRGACFCAGMNIDDFEAGLALSAPSLHNEIHDALSALSIPVVAAIHGGAHGGGLELALGCHFRVATSEAKLSLPEIQVGLMPGARGTQLLPRAVGLPAAADMILNARRVAARDAPAGLVDRVISEDVIAAAVLFALEHADTSPPHLQDRLVDSTELNLRDYISTETQGFPGIEPAIEMLARSTDLSYTEAVKQEFEAFLALKDSEISKPFQAAFLARLKAGREASG